MTLTADVTIALLGPYAAGTGLVAGQPTPRAVATYEALPAHYRRTDDGTLKALVVAMLELTGCLEALVDALNYVPPDEGGPPVGTVPGGRSILTDPDRPLWPVWLAQAVGVNLAGAGITNPFDGSAAEAIRAGVNGWRAGSTEALTAAAARTLTGARTVVIRQNPYGDPFVITVSTAAEETPDPDATEAAVRAVLPAGHDLELNNAVGNWNGIETLAPTWDDIDALTSDELEELYA